MKSTFSLSVWPPMLSTWTATSSCWLTTSSTAYRYCYYSLMKKMKLNNLLIPIVYHLGIQLITVKFYTRLQTLSIFCRIFSTMANVSVHFLSKFIQNGLFMGLRLKCGLLSTKCILDSFHLLQFMQNELN
jgi:hypothetical protein